MAEPTSRPKIIEAAWTLLTAVGVDKFSMRKLAKEVGITASTLYWHFPSKEAIFAEMVDAVCGEALTAFKVEPSWQQQFVSDGLIFAKTLRQRPSSAELLFMTPPITAHFLEVNEHFLVAIDDVAFTDSEKFTIVNMYINFILTFERDRQIRQQIGITANTDDIHPDEDVVTKIPVVNRIYQQGIFNQMDRETTLEWSLSTLVKGFEQRQAE
ncbi:TetR/AcrR family transcriptional regulator [Furfurilactobacillus sp. WILCCON 0119]